MRCRQIDVFAFLLLFCLPVMAAMDNTSQPFFIESDEMEMDDRRGVSEYRGSVRFSQGGIQLQADKIVVTTRQRRLQRVVARGQLVRLSQKTTTGDGMMRAEAEKIEYLPDGDRLLLTGQARLWQGGNEFSGDRIEYHLKDETVIARSDKDKPGRVRIVIQPKGKTDKSVPAVDENDGRNEALWVEQP